MPSPEMVPVPLSNPLHNVPPAVERIQAVVGIQRCLIEEWIEDFENEQKPTKKRRDDLAQNWIKKYAVVFRAEFEEEEGEYLKKWRERNESGLGWVWLSQMQSRLNDRLKKSGHKQGN